MKEGTCFLLYDVFWPLGFLRVLLKKFYRDSDRFELRDLERDLANIIYFPDCFDFVLLDFEEFLNIGFLRNRFFPPYSLTF